MQLENQMACVARSRDAGFTLIEVMISALILGVGLLGILTLQTKTLQYNHRAYLYSQSAFLAGDIADRMRINSGVGDNYLIDFEDAKTGVDLNKCVTGVCLETDFAEWDLAVWKSSLALALPQGDGAITKVDDQYVITTRFDDSRGGNAPRQISMTIKI